MERFIKDTQTIVRMRKGLLGPHLNAIAQQLHEQQYCHASACLQIRVIADFDRWLQRRGVALQEITSEHLQRYCKTIHITDVDEATTPP